MKVALLFWDHSANHDYQRVLRPGEWHFPLDSAAILPIGTEIYLSNDPMIAVKVVKHFFYPKENLLSLYVELFEAETDIRPEELLNYLNNNWIINSDNLREWTKMP